jgi:hypothetical protein
MTTSIQIFSAPFLLGILRGAGAHATASVNVTNAKTAVEERPFSLRTNTSPVPSAESYFYLLFFYVEVR